MSYSRLVRFLPRSSTTPRIGEPVDAGQDVGLATYNGDAVEVELFSGSSILSPGERTGERATVDRLLTPLAQSEVGTIRCIGLNYLEHIKEIDLGVPTVPTVFYKPATAMADPHPARIVVPQAVVADQATDYEAEVAIVIGKAAKDVREEDALDHVLGFTAANDVSSRVAQFAQSQWCFSKSFDSACPVGPAFVPLSAVVDHLEVKISGELDGQVVQQSGLHDLVFSIPKLIAFLSQGTTLPVGTLILTGTPYGVGWSAKPRRILQEGSEFRVNVSHGVGTLINKVEEEKGQ